MIHCITGNYAQDDANLEKDGILAPDLLQLAMTNGVDPVLILDYRVCLFNFFILIITLLNGRLL